MIIIPFAGIYLRKESEKHQKHVVLPAMSSKRKLRKRRAHGIRSANTSGDAVSTSCQLSLSQAEKIASPPTPVRSK